MAGIPARLLLPRESLLGLASMDDAAVKTLSTPEEKGISGAILNHDLVVPLAGLGGETGGPAAALVGRVARILGTATLGLAATPFTAEGINRRVAAERALALLSRKVDGLVAFSNDELLRLAPQLPLLRAFQVLGEIMVRPLVDLARAMTRTDAATLRGFLQSRARWRFGGGSGEGKHRAYAAVEEAFASPWLPRDPDLLGGIVAIVAAPDWGEALAGEVAREVRLAAPRAAPLVGGYADPGLGDRLRVSVLAGW